MSNKSLRLLQASLKCTRPGQSGTAHSAKWRWQQCYCSLHFTPLFSSDSHICVLFAVWETWHDEANLPPGSTWCGFVETLKDKTNKTHLKAVSFITHRVVKSLNEYANVFTGISSAPQFFLLAFSALTQLRLKLIGPHFGLFLLGVTVLNLHVTDVMHFRWRTYLLQNWSGPNWQTAGRCYT